MNEYKLKAGFTCKRSYKLRSKMPWQEYPGPAAVNGLGPIRIISEKQVAYAGIYGIIRKIYHRGVNA